MWFCGKTTDVELPVNVHQDEKLIQKHFNDYNIDTIIACKALKSAMDAGEDLTSYEKYFTDILTKHYDFLLVIQKKIMDSKDKTTFYFYLKAQSKVYDSIWEVKSFAIRLEEKTGCTFDKVEDFSIPKSRYYQGI